MFKKFFDREQNLLIHIIASIIVFLSGLILRLNQAQWLLIIFLIGFVITSELINSAVELAVDNYTSEFHPKAKIAKDVAAGAVLVSAITAALIGIWIFLPKIIYLITNL